LAVGLGPDAVDEVITALVDREWNDARREKGIVENEAAVAHFEAVSSIAIGHRQEVVNTIPLVILFEEARSRPSAIVAQIMVFEILGQDGAQPLLDRRYVGLGERRPGSAERHHSRSRLRR
jgi:hypothetical protein